MASHDQPRIKLGRYRSPRDMRPISLSHCLDALRCHYSNSIRDGQPLKFNARTRLFDASTQQLWSGPRNILIELVLSAGHKRPRRRRELRGLGGHKDRNFGRGPKNSGDITGGRRRLFDPPEDILGWCPPFAAKHSVSFSLPPTAGSQSRKPQTMPTK
jgi:hypothetical protein